MGAENQKMTTQLTSLALVSASLVGLRVIQEHFRELNEKVGAEMEKLHRKNEEQEKQMNEVKAIVRQLAAKQEQMESANETTKSVIGTTIQSLAKTMESKWEKYQESLDATKSELESLKEDKKIDRANVLAFRKGELKSLMAWKDSFQTPKQMTAGELSPMNSSNSSASETPLSDSSGRSDSETNGSSTPSKAEGATSSESIMVTPKTQGKKKEWMPIHTRKTAAEEVEKKPALKPQRSFLSKMFLPPSFA